MHVLVLYGAYGPNIQPLYQWVERLAPEMGITPIFLQCADWNVVRDLAATAQYRILPLDDAAVALAAHLSPQMARPMTIGDPHALEDKWGQRTAFLRHGVPSPPFALVETVSDVEECGQQWGYPLMLKPARGTASRGVRRIDGRAEASAGLTVARMAAKATGVDRVLAEGYLDGPDVAIESLVLDGVTHHVSYWQSGWTGNDLWQAATPLGAALRPHIEAMGAAIAQANEALGLRWAATSNELRVTAAGPMLVEVNARLGGGPCEDAILLHSGIDRVRATLAMLCDKEVTYSPLYRRPLIQTVMRTTSPGMVQAVEAPTALVENPAVQLTVQLAPGTAITGPSLRDIGWMLLQGEPDEDADVLLPRATSYARQIRVTMSRQDNTVGQAPSE